MLVGSGFVPSVKFSLGSLAGANIDVRPFPCQHHACGCKDAASCGTRCCCFSPAQVRDWERRHAREIAAYERRHSPAKQSIASQAASSSPRKSTAACCSRCLAAESSKPSSASPKSTLACKPAAATQPSPATATEPDSPPSLAVGWVSLDAQRRCRGVAPFWVVMAQALPADILPAWQPADELIERLTLVALRPIWRAWPPATPPPR
ncbi:MAG: hypothetical protein U1A77_10030 [Pirellulales bacterium]